MGSQFADTKIADIDFASLSDEQLQDIVDNDDRSSAQDAAQAELDSRADAAEADGAGEGDAPADPEKDFSVTSATLPDDPKERAAALGLNAEGIDTRPDAGQLQVQDHFDRVEESGFTPPSGGPPDDSLTLGKVGEREQADKEARRAALEEAVAGE